MYYHLHPSAVSLIIKPALRYMAYTWVIMIDFVGLTSGKYSRWNLLAVRIATRKGNCLEFGTHLYYPPGDFLFVVVIVLFSKIDVHDRVNPASGNDVR